MAQIPYNPVPQVAPQAGGLQYEGIQANPADFGAAVGGAEQKLGQDIGQTSDVLAQNAVRIQTMNDETAARNTSNAYIQDAGKAWADYSTLQGKASVDAYPAFTKKLEDLQQQHADTLNNPVARNQFLNASGYMLNRLTLMSSTHAAQQQKEYWKQSYVSNVENMAQTGVLYQNDPSMVDSAANSIEHSVGAIGELNSWDPNMVKSNTATALGRYYKGVIESQATTNPAIAQSTFDRVKSRMDANSIVEVGRSLRARSEQNSVGSAINDFGNTLQPGPAAPQGKPAQGADINATWERMLGVEHGEDASGNALVSSAGATGAAQTRETTAADTAQKHGVPYHPEALKPGPGYDSSYSKMMGRLYFGDMMERYSGNTTLAAAAYNAGPGRVDEWVKSIGDPRQGVMSNADWANRIPIAETKGYVLRTAQPSAIAQPAGVTFGRGGAQPASGQKGGAAPGDTGGVAIDEGGEEAPRSLGATPASLPGEPAAAGTPAPASAGTPPPGTATHNPAGYGAEADIMKSAWQKAGQLFPGRPDLQHQYTQGIWQRYVTEPNILQQKYEAEQAKAQRDAQEAAGQQVIKMLMTPGAKFDPAVIRDNPALTYAQKESLWRLSESHLANPDSNNYGPGFWKAFQQVHAPQDDPDRITDPSQLWPRGGPGGDLSMAGIDKLTSEITGRRTPDGEAEGQMKKSFFDGARAAITLPGPMGEKDAIGAQKFAQFQVLALSAYEDGRKNGLSPQQLLSEKSPDYIGRLVPQFVRTNAEKMRDYQDINKFETDAVVNGATGGGVGANPGAGAGKSTPAKLDLTTKEGITAAYRAGHYGVGPAGWDAAVADLRSKGFLPKPAGLAPSGPRVPTD